MVEETTETVIPNVGILLGTVLILNPWLNRENENGRILLSVKIKESFLENTLTSANSNVVIYRTNQLSSPFNLYSINQKLC